MNLLTKILDKFWPAPGKDWIEDWIGAHTIKGTEFPGWPVQTDWKIGDPVPPEGFNTLNTVFDPGVYKVKEEETLFAFPLEQKKKKKTKTKIITRSKNEPTKTRNKNRQRKIKQK